MRHQLLWASLWLVLVPCSASAQEFSEKQVEAVIKRGEQLLLDGQPKQAIERTRQLSAMLLGEGALSYTQFEQFVDRATVMSATAIMRLEGRDPTRPSAEPRKNLEEAEKRFVELLGSQPTRLSQPANNSCNCSEGTAQSIEKPAFWRSRYGETLVALGKFEEAYRVLSALLVSSTLSEAEGAAALARAATELSNEQMATAANARCRELAKKRAKTVCRMLAKPTAAR